MWVLCLISTNRIRSGATSKATAKLFGAGRTLGGQARGLSACIRPIAGGVFLRHIANAGIYPSPILIECGPPSLGGKKKIMLLIIFLGVRLMDRKGRFKRPNMLNPMVLGTLVTSGSSE